MSDPRPQVVLALTPPAERAIEDALFGPEAAVVPAASVAEADELERLLDAGYAAVLVAPALAGLTGGHIARARSAGLRVVGVALDEHDERELAALGVDATVTPASSNDDVRAAAGVDSGEPSTPPVQQEPEAAPRRGSAVVAVVGSKGAPGASECAASLAALAWSRWPTLLVELDALGGTLALRVGADAAQGSLLAVTRAVAAGDGAIGELVERWLCRRGGWPPTLALGEPLEDAVAALAQPGATRGALDAVAAAAPASFVDVGFLLADGGETSAASRVHREALVCADAVVLVLGARESQLESGLRQLDLLLDELSLRRERLRIVVSGLDGPGASSRRDLEQALLDRLASRELTADAWLPWDARALRRANTLGVPLAVARPRGPFARALAGFLEQLFLPTAPVPPDRKRKLPQPVARDDEEVPLPWRS